MSSRSLPPFGAPLRHQFARCRCQSAWQSGCVFPLVSSPPRNLKQTRCGLRAAKLPPPPAFPTSCHSPLWWHKKPRLSLGFCCREACVGAVGGDVSSQIVFRFWFQVESNLCCCQPPINHINLLQHYRFSPVPFQKYVCKFMLDPRSTNPQHAGASGGGGTV